MNSIKTKKPCAYYLSLCASCLMAFSFSSAQAATCSPGDHWVDSCIGGTDNVTNISGVFAIDFIGLGLFVIPVEGNATTITRSDAFDALNVGHNNQINMELVSATMMNIDPIPGAGSVTVRVGIGSGVSTATTGAIIEQGNAALADSFFDLFFEVDSSLGTFHNVTPVRLIASIDQWDPNGGVYYGIDPNFALPQILTSTGLVIANTIAIDGVTGLTLGRTAVPVPAAAYLFGSGLFAMAGFARRKNKVAVI